MSESFLNGRVVLHAGDSRDVLKTLADNSIDSIVTDPPYALVSIQKRFGKPGSAPVKVGDINASNDLKAAYARASAGFMGKNWDTGETAFATEFWAQCLRVLKPGGHVVAFSGTRTYHRMACAIEDAGFEIRDQLQWVYGSGFPKSHDVSKGIDRAAGAERAPGIQYVAPDGKVRGVDLGIQGGSFAAGNSNYVAEKLITAPATASALQWQGWGTALKPSCEPICFGRKPLSEKTVAANVLAHGVGAINIDGCRIHSDDAQGGEYTVKRLKPGATLDKTGGNWRPEEGGIEYHGNMKPGRWPANLLHDGSDEVLAGFPHSASGTGAVKRETGADTGGNTSTAYGKESRPAGTPMICHGDEGSAARFFYTSKADSDDRLGSKHPTVKPVDLMQWLCRLVTPPGGTILDCFAGTGTTGEAAFREGFNAVLIEREAEYQADIRRRMALVLSGPDERARESIKARLKDTPVDHGPLFGGLDPIAEAAE